MGLFSKSTEQLLKEEYLKYLENIDLSNIIIEEKESDYSYYKYLVNFKSNENSSIKFDIIRTYTCNNYVSSFKTFKEIKQYSTHIDSSGIIGIISDKEDNDLIQRAINIIEWKLELYNKKLKEEEKENERIRVALANEKREEELLKEYNRIKGITLTNEFSPEFKVMKRLNELADEQIALSEGIERNHKEIFKLRDKYYSLTK